MACRIAGPKGDIFNEPGVIKSAYLEIDVTYAYKIFGTKWPKRPVPSGFAWTGDASNPRWIPVPIVGAGDAENIKAVTAAR